MKQKTENKKHIKRTYDPLPKELEVIRKKIVDSAYTVYKTLGPGLLEKVYEICFCHELKNRGLAYVRQFYISICI